MWHGFDDTNDNDGDHYYVDDDDDNDDDVNDDDDDDDKIYTEAVSTASRSWCRTYKQVITRVERGQDVKLTFEWW